MLDTAPHKARSIFRAFVLQAPHADCNSLIIQANNLPKWDSKNNFPWTLQGRGGEAVSNDGLPTERRIHPACATNRD